MLASKERIYLQYRPDESSLGVILNLQKKSTEANPQGRPVQQERLHVTVIHFGIAADVYRELSQQNPKLNWEEFARAAEQFITLSQSALPEEVTVQPTGLEFFGHRSSVLALSVRPDQTLIDAHQSSLQQLKDFLEACGISYPVAFMQGSTNFRYALTLRPHFSLVKAARHVPEDAPSDFPALKLKAMPIHYS
jgi:2'-5' RNA ligase